MCEGKGHESRRLESAAPCTTGEAAGRRATGPTPPPRWSGAYSHAARPRAIVSRSGAGPARHAGMVCFAQSSVTTWSSTPAREARKCLGSDWEVSRKCRARSYEGRRRGRVVASLPSRAGARAGAAGRRSSPCCGRTLPGPLGSSRSISSNLAGPLHDAAVLLNRDEVRVRPLAVQVVEGRALLGAEGRRRLLSHVSQDASKPPAEAALPSPPQRGCVASRSHHVAMTILPPGLRTRLISCTYRSLSGMCSPGGEGGGGEGRREGGWRRVGWPGGAARPNGPYLRTSPHISAYLPISRAHPTRRPTRGRTSCRRRSC